MVSTANNTESDTTDRAIAQSFVASFTDQLKDWWDHCLEDQDR